MCIYIYTNIHIHKQSTAWLSAPPPAPDAVWRRKSPTLFSRT